MDKKYYSVNEAAQIMSIKPKRLREMCHARGQKFAIRLTPRGKFYIDIEKFDEFLKRKIA